MWCYRTDRTRRRPSTPGYHRPDGRFARYLLPAGTAAAPQLQVADLSRRCAAGLRGRDGLRPRRAHHAGGDGRARDRGLRLRAQGGARGSVRFVRRQQAELVGAITPPGAGIIINSPVYPPFWFRFGFYGRRIIEAPLARDAAGRYDLDPAAIESALRQPGAAVYLLCSPHNPTGNVWTRDQLSMVADLC